MQISQTFPEVQQKTLFVVADHTHAKLFLAEGRDFQFLEEIKTDYPSNGGGDRTSMITPGGMHSAEQNERDSIIGEDHLFHTLAKNLFQRKQNNEFEALVIAAGPEVHEFEKLLHTDVRACVTRLIPKLLVKLDDASLIEHLLS